MTTENAEGDNPAINAPTGGTFGITRARLYVPVVTLSTEKMIINYLKELLNGIWTDHKCLIRLKITI